MQRVRAFGRADPMVDPTAQVAVVSDIDDTVLVTALPRPLRAAWNTFVRHESTRRPVRGMATLYRTIAAEHPDAPSSTSRPAPGTWRRCSSSS